MPIVLLCTTVVGDQVRAYGEAARRAGITIRLVSDCCDDLEAPWRDRAVRARFGKDPRHVADVLAALGETPVDAVVAVGDGPAWLAAHIARARRLPWHDPDAVAVTTHKLHARGRLLAAGLPVPWFVGIPSRGDDGLERLTRVRFPCVMSPVGLPSDRGAIRVDSLPELLAARQRLATVIADLDPQATASIEDEAVIVEALVPGRQFALDGVLEQGALRVFALFEKATPLPGPSGQDAISVTPARLAPARQQVIAGHIARAALALGLHHGPVHAECRVDGDETVVLEVTPWAGGGLSARAVPVIAPDGTRCALEDAWLAHALGQPLDGFGHQAIASGVLMAPMPGAWQWRDAEGVDQVRVLPGVTAAELTARPPALLEPLTGGERYACVVFAEAADPDQVIETLREASRRLRMTPERAPSTSRDQA